MDLMEQPLVFRMVFLMPGEFLLIKSDQIIVLLDPLRKVAARRIEHHAQFEQVNTISQISNRRSTRRQVAFQSGHEREAMPDQGFHQVL